MEWINVQERLPEMEGVYLTLSLLRKRSNNDAPRIRAEFFGQSKRFGYGWKGRDVTHWMPLPPPPKE